MGLSDYVLNFQVNGKNEKDFLPDITFQHLFARSTRQKRGIRFIFNILIKKVKKQGAWSFAPCAPNFFAKIF